MKKVLVFDLDGTLSESKQPLDNEMAHLLEKLLDQNYFVAVMSGGSFEQYRSQLLPTLEFLNNKLTRVVLLPTSGASLYLYQNNNWQMIYEKSLTEKEVSEITDALYRMLKNQIAPQKTYGQIIENRQTQITFSGLGQEAPLEEKIKWDPDQTKRRKIVEALKPQLSDFNLQIGGTTSIDITKKGVDKAYGIKQLSHSISIPIKEMLYIGDALFPGGNDEPVKASGIQTRSVNSVSETKEFLRGIIDHSFQI